MDMFLLNILLQIRCFPLDGFVLHISPLLSQFPILDMEDIV